MWSLTLNSGDRGLAKQYWSKHSPTLGLWTATRSCFSPDEKMKERTDFTNPQDSIATQSKPSWLNHQKPNRAAEGFSPPAPTPPPLKRDLRLACGSALGGSQSLSRLLAGVMNDHPPFFDRYWTLLLEPLVCHTGPGCQCGGAPPRALIGR